MKNDFRPYKIGSSCQLDKVLKKAWALTVWTGNLQYLLLKGKFNFTCSITSSIRIGMFLLYVYNRTTIVCGMYDKGKEA